MAANGIKRASKAKADTATDLAVVTDLAISQFVQAQKAAKRAALLSWLRRVADEVGRVQNLLQCDESLPDAFTEDETNDLVLGLDRVWSPLSELSERLTTPAELAGLK